MLEAGDPVPSQQLQAPALYRPPGTNQAYVLQRPRSRSVPALKPPGSRVEPDGQIFGAADQEFGQNRPVGHARLKQAHSDFHYCYNVVGLLIAHPEPMDELGDRQRRGGASRHGVSESGGESSGTSSTQGTEVMKASRLKDKYPYKVYAVNSKDFARSNKLVMSTKISPEKVYAGYSESTEEEETTGVVTSQASSGSRRSGGEAGRDYYEETTEHAYSMQRGGGHADYEDSDEADFAKHLEEVTKKRTPPLLRVRRPGPGAMQRAVLDTETNQAANRHLKTQAYRRVYFIRNGERMDRIFPNWIQECFTENGQYIPYDMNQPLKIPGRDGGPNDFYEDGPITEIGTITSQMVGKAFRVCQIKPSVVYSSPALMCIQTATQIIEYANTPAKIRIEPGLFEWMRWYEEGVPNFMSPEALEKVGYPIDLRYSPYMSVRNLVHRKTESIKDLYSRLVVVSRQIRDDCPATGHALIVAHAVNLDAGPQALLGTKIKVPSENDLARLSLFYPYCSSMIVDELRNGDWELVPQGLPNITYFDFNNRANWDFFMREVRRQSVQRQTEEEEESRLKGGHHRSNSNQVGRVRKSSPQRRRSSRKSKNHERLALPVAVKGN